MDNSNKEDTGTPGKNSQELHLRMIVKKSITALAMGGVIGADEKWKLRHCPGAELCG